jgi:hypothetical protein
MQEKKQDEPEKIWLVISNVPHAELEKKLNEVADKGYQVFRLERFNDPATAYFDVGHPTPPKGLYDIVAFNPTLLGAKSMEGMAELARRAAAQALETAGGQPATGA